MDRTGEARTRSTASAPRPWATAGAARTGSSGTSSSRPDLGARAQPREREPVDRTPSEPEQRREQRDRGDHGQQHGQAGADGHATKEIPMMNRPSIEMHTLTPARSTARPAGVRAVEHASLDDAPSRRHARKRVRTKRAKSLPTPRPIMIASEGPKPEERRGGEECVSTVDDQWAR